MLSKWNLTSNIYPLYTINKLLVISQNHLKPQQDYGFIWPRRPRGELLNCSLTSRTHNLVDTPHLLPEGNWERGVEEVFPECLVEKIEVRIVWNDLPVKNRMAKSFEQCLNAVTKASPRSVVFCLSQPSDFSLKTFISSFESVITSKYYPRESGTAMWARWIRWF